MSNSKKRAAGRKQRTTSDQKPVERRRLLWIDDHIMKLEPYCRALRTRAGFDVREAESAKEAIELAEAETFDIVLADIRMPKTNGIEALRKLHQLQPNAILAVLSSYLYLELYRQELRSLDFSVELIDKDMPRVDADDFEARFVKPILNVAEKGVTFTITKQDEKLTQISSVDPFGISLNEFMEKSVVEKDGLLREARRLAEPALIQAFGEGKIWVLLCGSRKKIRRAVERLEDVPDEQEIMEIAIKRQRAPYQFYQPVEVEDMWSGCPAKTHSSDYPTVSLIVENKELVVHFDTGAPMTFFSYEELLRLNAIHSTSVSVGFQKGNEYLSCVNLNLEVLLKCQARGLMKTVRVRGLAVRNWLSSSFARYCTDDCEKRGIETSSQRYLCRFRRGLAGRNIVTENKIVLILDGRSKRTRLGS